jgi:hypothetical protein
MQYREKIITYVSGIKLRVIQQRYLGLLWRTRVTYATDWHKNPMGDMTLIKHVEYEYFNEDDTDD